MAFTRFDIQPREMWAKYFWPPFLHIVLPFFVLMLVFGVIRIVCAKFLRHSRPLRILVDSVIILLFLLAAGLMAPIVINSVRIPVPEELTNGDLFSSTYESVVSGVTEAMEKEGWVFESSSSSDSSQE